MKFIQYFIKEAHGYYEFEAKNIEEAEEKMDRFSTYVDLDKQLRIKSDYWKMTELNEEGKELIKK